MACTFNGSLSATVKDGDSSHSLVARGKISGTIPSPIKQALIVTEYFSAVAKEILCSAHEAVRIDENFAEIVDGLCDWAGLASRQLYGYTDR